MLSQQQSTLTYGHHCNHHDDAMACLPRERSAGWYDHRSGSQCHGHSNKDGNNSTTARNGLPEDAPDIVNMETDRRREHSNKDSDNSTAV